MTKGRNSVQGIQTSADLYLIHCRHPAVPWIQGENPPLFLIIWPYYRMGWKTFCSQALRQRCKCKETLMHWGHDVAGQLAQGKTGRKAAPHGVLMLMGYFWHVAPFLMIAFECWWMFCSMLLIVGGCERKLWALSCSLCVCVTWQGWCLRLGTVEGGRDWEAKVRA